MHEAVAPATDIRAVVLDFNGTLAQDDAVVARLYIDLFASLGLSLTSEEYQRDLAALPDRDVFELALRRAGVPTDTTRREALVIERVNGYLAALDVRSTISRSAVDFVTSAARHVPLAIGSAAFRVEIEAALAMARISDCFQVIVAIEDVARGKPDPEVFTTAIARLNETLQPSRLIQPHEVVVIEDSTGGALAGRAAGTRVAAIRGPAYDAASGHAELILDCLDGGAVAPVLALGRRTRRAQARA